MKCKICKKSFKRITPSHLKSHNLTLERYNKRFKSSKARIKSLVKFINEHYITVRYRFLEYIDDKVYTKTIPDKFRSWKLCDADIEAHLKNKKTIGVYFPEHCSKFIGLDIDTQDLELLNSVYETIKNYGIDDDNFLISSSGNKGYHIDIFLDEFISKPVINKFYKILLNDSNTTKKQVELRGGGGQGYKLPLGYHQTTGNECYSCDSWGNKVKFEPSEIKKLSAKWLHDIVDINYCPETNKNNETVVKANELFSDIDTTKIYDKNNQSRLQTVQKLIERGVNEIGKRHISIREVAAYCKDHEKLCIAETIEFITSWVNKTWKQTIVDKQLLKSIANTVQSIYKTNFKFYVSIEPRAISLPELKEILSVKTNNELETNALRRIYFILTVHSKAYSNKNQVFSMSYQQIQEMGGSKNNSALAKQLTKLSELGKLMIIERNVRNPDAGKKGQKLNKPNKYQLPFFQTLELTKPNKLFNICKKPKCKDCMEKALCYLLNNKERVKFIKGKKFKNLGKCKYNKNSSETAQEAA